MPSGPTAPSVSTLTGPLIGANVNGTAILGPSGDSTVAVVNVGASTAATSGSGLAIDLLTQDGTTASVALPTSAAAVQDALAPVGNLVGALAGEAAGNGVMQVTTALSPTVATVTSAIDGVAQPVLDGVNNVLTPIVGQGGLLAPVTGTVGGLVDGLAGNLPAGGTDPARGFDGPLLAASAGGAPVTGASTSGTLVGVNLGGSPSVQGQLITANVLTDGATLEVNLPTTAQGVQAGLAPVGNLAGALLGEQAGALVDQVSGSISPVVAPVANIADQALGATGSGTGGLLAPVTGIVGQTVGGVGGGAGEGGAALAPVTGLLGSVTGSTGGGAGGLLAPVTDTLGQVLGNAGGSTGEGGLLAPVTGVVNQIGGGGTPAAGSPLAPVTGLLGGLLGRRGN